MSRLGIGDRGVRVVNPLQDLPRGAPGARGQWPRPDIRRVKGLDGEPVIGLADEPFLKRRSLENAIDKLEPFLPAREREIGGERKIDIVCHAPKNAMAGPPRQSNIL